MMPTEEDYSKMSDEEISECWKKVRKKELDLCAVLIEDVKNSEANERLESTKKDFEHIEKLLEFDDKIFYFVYNDDTSNLELTEDEKQVLDKIIKSYGYIKDNLCIFKAVDEEEGFMHEEGKSVMEGSLSEFTAQTTDEKDVNQEIFKKYDITMVNVWTTWCGYCVEEMKDIQTLYKKIPDNVNIISVCVDGDSEKEIVEEIIKDKGMEFLTIRGNDELKDTFYKYVEAYPTTVFVDQNGNIVGKEQVGVPENGYGELINDALETIGKERSVK
jgi:thiol-disulfide isomerase/thioredoxin